MTAPVPPQQARQRDSFLGGEGDQWFARNDGAEIAAHTKHALDTILNFVRPGNRVLEIGCADGRNLAYLARSCSGVTCEGLEPSGAAVEAARARHPGILVQAGTADRLPYERGSFDVLCFGFCLYLVDRELLMQSMAEADRVLRDRGYLAIIDFDPVGPRRRRYRHLDGLYSYKMDYGRILLASSHYHLAAKTGYSHAGSSYSTDPGERVATTVLYKDIAAGYLPEDD